MTAAPLSPTALTPTAEALLDAQVAWALEELSGDRLHALVARDVDTAWEIAAHVPLGKVLTAEDITRVITAVLESLPASVAATTLVEALAAVVHEGPSEPVVPADLVAREHVEALVTEAQGLTPLLERALDRVSDSPMAATLASRFVSRIVVDVLEANRAAAEKIPGVGSIMSLGTSAASKVIGAADKPLQMMGATANKGATMVARRLSAVVVETARDPLVHKAVMEVWDAQADRAVDDVGQALEAERVQRIAGLLQEVVINAAPTPAVTAFVAAVAERFMDVYGEHPVATLWEEAGVERDLVVAELQRLVPPLVEAARVDGRLEQAVRERLEPFFASPAVAAILDS